MTKLPEIIDFDETQFPALQPIFQDMDTAIAAMIASDPAFRPKPTPKRRARTTKPIGTHVRRSRSTKRVAA